MKFNYPKGQSLPFHQNNEFKNHKHSQTNYGNRGMSLEEDLQLTNEQYRMNKVAIVHKKPTPIQVVKVDYPKRSAAKITEAYYRRPSTTDFNGVYQGHYIDFEAKETKQKNYLPLKNFHSHQIKHMKECQNAGGICFVIVRFSKRDQTFLYPADALFKWWVQREEPSGRKSIPYEDFLKRGYEIPLAYSPRLPYLKALDEWLAFKS